MPLDADPDGRSSATAATTANPARALTHLCNGVGEVVILAQPLRTPSPAPAARVGYFGVAQECGRKGW